MRQKKYALVDCNNFYASCERIFNPRLEGRPVIVLSNNDGCVIARSNEAKALGIKMGVPAFEIKDLIELNKVNVFSSNFRLYGDISHRVMNILSRLAPDMEIYSIDEAFLDLTALPAADNTQYGKSIRETVRQHTGIPVSVGIGPTKTLAKIANHLAKRRPEFEGVLDISSHSTADAIFKTIPVEEVWGVGRAYSSFLRQHKIETVYDLKNADDKWVRKNMTVMGQRTVWELNGLACISMELMPPDKKGICTSRSFGTPLERYEDLEQATSAFMSRTAEKLRQQHSAARTLTVFIMTNRFAGGPRYVNSKTLQLPVATSNTPELIHYALIALKKIFRPGYRYKKSGVFITDLIPDDQLQYSIWDDSNREKFNRLMKIIDTVNAHVGQGAIKFAVQGSRRRWKMHQERLSPSYTTRWSDILLIDMDHPLQSEKIK